MKSRGNPQERWVGQRLVSRRGLFVLVALPAVAAVVVVLSLPDVTAGFSHPSDVDGMVFYSAFLMTYFVSFAAMFFLLMALHDRARRALSIRRTPDGMEVRMPLQSGYFVIPWVDVLESHPAPPATDWWLVYHLRDEKATRARVRLSLEQFEAVRGQLPVRTTADSVGA